ncbi:hypothetical protein BDV28DRAFT_140373 [Aspergillus coremiiformis]|uniref:Protein kinase domain-containing protein n=1 Tax=Aspergillus coremiiformis TaxID=138285 RepID=A0A5N6YWP9_9EURO|nr:hypothetical protein BDV28DRAFT_140373 [Aspergillus coremiiformis]
MSCHDLLDTTAPAIGKSDGEIKATPNATSDGSNDLHKTLKSFHIGQDNNIPCRSDSDTNSSFSGSPTATDSRPRYSPGINGDGPPPRHPDHRLVVHHHGICSSPTKLVERKTFQNRYYMSPLSNIAHPSRCRAPENRPMFDSDLLSSDPSSPVACPTDRRLSVEQESFMLELSRAIQNKTHRRGNPSEKFITRNSLAGIWNQSCLERFLDMMRPGFDHTMIDRIREDFLQTLSILVDIGWQEWWRFGAIFLNHKDANHEGDRSDRMIPTYVLATLEDNSFLGSPWAEKFLNNRSIFCPINIQEGKSLVLSKEWKLPFINEESIIIGNGAYGKVTKEIIGSGHYRSQHEHYLPGVPYSKDLPVARKSFEAKGDFGSETKNLDILRSSLSKHDRIVPFIATVTIGNEFNILSPLADMNLDEYLSEGHQRSPDFTVRDLMEEAAHLAGALTFLHQGLDSHPPGLRCCHMDLKPKNILVFQGHGSNFPKVGKWKISDFGISMISPEKTGTTVTEFMDTFVQQKKPPPPPATYRPPDGADHGLKSDIWSLGCIMTRVLALGLEGVDGMRRLDQLRGTKVDGVSDYQDDYFYRGSPPKLNPHVQKWLCKLPRSHHNYHPEFLEGCKSLILSMLAIIQDDRPSAREVQERLHPLVNIAHPIVVSPPSTGASVCRTESVGSGSHYTRSSSTGIPGGDDYLGHLLAVIQGRCHIDQKFKDNGERLLVYTVQKGIGSIEGLFTQWPGLDCETPDSKGDTPLKLAAEGDNPEILKVLLNAGTRVDAPSRRGLTPLMSACRHGRTPMVQLLLDSGANCRYTSQDGYTSLHYATFSNNGADVIRCLRGRVSFNIPREGNKDTPLLTLFKNYVDLPSWWDKLEALLDGSADIDMANAEGVTPFSYAEQEGYCKLVERLRLKRGAEYEGPPDHSHLPSENMTKVLNRSEQRRPSQNSAGSSAKSFFRGAHRILTLRS